MFVLDHLLECLFLRMVRNVINIMHKCEYCDKEFDGPVTSGHKRKCVKFLEANPDRVPPACLCGHVSTSLTQMKRHRKSCKKWQSRNKNVVASNRLKDTYEKKYGKGVTNPVHVPEVRAKKAATMKDRYGAENPFSRESVLFDRIQSYWDGRNRTAHLSNSSLAKSKSLITERSLSSRIIKLKQNHDQVDFNFKNVSFCVGDTNGVRDFLEEHHYAGYGRAGNQVYMATLNGSVIGVIKFAPPIRQGIAKSIGVENKHLMELDRFCIHPANHKKNFASYFMSKILKLVKTDLPHLKKLVSFADPRFGHFGTIYKASNWTLVGETSPSYYYFDSIGQEINKKTLYERAKRLCMSERQYADTFKYRKIKTPPKIKFVYDLM